MESQLFIGKLLEQGRDAFFIVNAPDGLTK
jgi:hypothetical protein